MSKEAQFRKIISDYAEGKLSAREVKKLEHLILKHPVGEPWDWEDNAHKEAMERRIREKLETKWGQRKKNNHTRILITWAVAACLACFCAFIYFYSTRTTTVKPYEIAKAKTYTSDQVVLIMPDGKEINVGTSASISDFKQNMDLKKSREGNDLITVKVPSQKQFNLTLDDGTKVWLNAGSILRFPALFTKQSERIVSLEGEGYFEVVSSKAQPFKVMALGTEVKVTGTKFNVQAYEADHAVKTSLLEGHVFFSIDKKVYQLRPGQQTLADIDNKQVLSQSFDAYKVLSWKAGYFVFDNTGLSEVMKTVSRWYNITVVAHGPIINNKIGGTFPNNVPLSDFLEDLSLLSGLKFKINGGEVLIMN